MIQITHCGCKFEFIRPDPPMTDQINLVKITKEGLEEYLKQFTPKIKITFCDGHFLQISSLSKRSIEVEAL